MEQWAGSWQVMGGPAALRLWSDGGVDLAEAGQLARSEWQRLEAKYSRFLATSWLHQVNAHAGSARRWRVDDETASLLNLGAQLHRISHGAFDLTAGALQRLWDFRHAELPETGRLSDALSRCGWHRLHWDGQELALPEPGLSLDLGGLVKEYAADRAVQLLRQQGVLGGYVNLAGDIALVGPQADGTPWTFGVQHPRQADATVAGVALAQGALATSGDYERGFDLDGRRYHHLLDARRGWPVGHWASVSVAGPSAAAAGALATVAMLLEAEGLSLLEGSGCWYLAVRSSGEIHTLDPSSWGCAQER